jgi:3-polyprenyl-4-hydroxybenzoate decarboxylase
VVEEPTSNASRVAFKEIRAKAKCIIFDSVVDNIMPVMTPLMTTKECMDTLINLYEKKAQA